MSPKAEVGRGSGGGLVTLDGGTPNVGLINEGVVGAKSSDPIGIIFTVSSTLDDEEFMLVAGAFGFEIGG